MKITIFARDSEGRFRLHMPRAQRKWHDTPPYDRAIASNEPKTRDHTRQRKIQKVIRVVGVYVCAHDGSDADPQGLLLNV